MGTFLSLGLQTRNRCFFKNVNVKEQKIFQMDVKDVSRNVV